MDLHRSGRRPAHGFTLVEWMITLAVVAILATLAVPSLRLLMDKYLLKAAAQSLYDDVQLARSEAIRRSAHTAVQFASTPPSWCAVIGTVASAHGALTCSCAAVSPEPSCIKRSLPASNQTDFRSIGLVASGEMRFEPSSGLLLTSTGGDSETLFVDVVSAYSSRSVRVSVSPVGIPSLCSPPAPAVVLSEFAACE